MKDYLEVLTIISTFNRAHMLSEAIESALDQDYPHKKVVVIDDGSTDDTVSVCKKYKESYKEQFSYVYKENGGCASARNKGLDFIRENVGFVCFLDSDDRFLPGKLSREIEQLRNHPECDFVYSNYVLYDAAKNTEKVCQVAAAGHPERFAIEHFLTNEAKSCAMLYRARVFQKIRFREELKLNEDSDFVQRLAIEYKGLHSKEPDSWIRWHGGSKSYSDIAIHQAVLKVDLAILKEYPDFYRSHRLKIDGHIKRIKRLIFEKMVVNGNWSEAADYSQSLFEKGILFFHCKYCLRILKKLRKALSIFMHLRRARI